MDVLRPIKCKQMNPPLCNGSKNALLYLHSSHYFLNRVSLHLGSRPNSLYLCRHSHPLHHSHWILEGLGKFHEDP